MRLLPWILLAQACALAPAEPPDCRHGLFVQRAQVIDTETKWSGTPFGCLPRRPIEDLGVPRCQLVEERFGEGECDDVAGRARLDASDPTVCEVTVRARDEVGLAGYRLIAPDAICRGSPAQVVIEPRTPANTLVTLRCQTALSEPATCE
ncbi:MAG: hypothetical protein RID81_05830 [Sandaracinaceae bacterium]